VSSRLPTGASIRCAVRPASLSRSRFELGIRASGYLASWPRLLRRARLASSSRASCATISQRSPAAARRSATARRSSTAREAAISLGPKATGSRALTSTRVRSSWRESIANRCEFDDFAVFESRRLGLFPLSFSIAGGTWPKRRFRQGREDLAKAVSVEYAGTSSMAFVIARELPTGTAYCWHSGRTLIRRAPCEAAQCSRRGVAGRRRQGAPRSRGSARPGVPHVRRAVRACRLR
jgi:hypothetical protein